MCWGALLGFIAVVRCRRQKSPSGPATTSPHLAFSRPSHAAPRSLTGELRLTTDPDVHHFWTGKKKEQPSTGMVARFRWGRGRARCRHAFCHGSRGSDFRPPPGPSAAPRPLCVCVLVCVIV